MESNKKQLEAKVNDCLRLCDKYAMSRFTCFFTEEEQAELDKIAAYDYNVCFYGGYDDAKRRMFGVFPEWQEVNYDEFPIKIVQFKKKYPKELTHRDYLGTVLSLGIERNKIGDILVDQNGAYVFATDSIADVISGIEKVSNCGIKTKIVSLNEIEIPKQEYEDLHLIVASMRLDAFVASITRLSRSQALLLIRGGKVSLNHKVCENVSKNIVVGDVFSLRGYGRYVFFSEGGETGSGRIHVHVKKFK